MEISREGDFIKIGGISPANDVYINIIEAALSTWSDDSLGFVDKSTGYTYRDVYTNLTDENGDPLGATFEEALAELEDLLGADMEGYQFRKKFTQGVGQYVAFDTQKELTTEKAGVWFVESKAYIYDEGGLLAAIVFSSVVARSLGDGGQVVSSVNVPLNPSVSNGMAPIPQNSIRPFISDNKIVYRSQSGTVALNFIVKFSKHFESI